MNPSKIIITKSGDRKFTFSKSGDYAVVLDNVSGEFIFEIETSGVNLNIYGICRGNGEDKYAIRTVQHHKAKDSWSNLIIKGVFDGNSQFDYRGLIRIEEDCNGSHAYQKNQNLLLSPLAKVTSEPDLEILSPDVFCTHGSSTGGINKESLYFIRSRGIPEGEARKLMVDGFLQDVTSMLE